MWFPLINVEVGIFFFALFKLLQYFIVKSLIQILITEVPEFLCLKSNKSYRILNTCH